MKFQSNKINLRNLIIAILFCFSGVLGYLYYESHSTNIKDKELIKETKEENLDLSQDLEIYRDKHDNLKEEIKSLKSKTLKVSYKKHSKKKRYISSAGKSGKNRSHFSKGKVSYKKLYFQLKNKCTNHKNKKIRNYSYKKNR